MANILDFGGVRALTSNAQPGAGYVAEFYVSGTTTPVIVYTDSTLGTAHGTSVTADSAGRFAAVWSSGGAIKCIIKDADGATVQTIDPVISVSGGGSDAEDITFTPTVELPFTNVQDAIEGAAASAASGFGVYGLGITGNATLLANLDATNTGAGVYRFDNTTTGTFPTGVAAVDTGLVEHWRQGGATAMQFLYHATTDRIFHRRMASTTWGTWREALTVNQGAAEGDVIYRGASAWTRLAKGTAGQALTMNAGATAPEWASGVRVLLATKTASASATLDFTEFNNAVYRYYEFEMENAKPATDNVVFSCRFSTDGGSSYDSGASDYTWAAMARSSAGDGSTGFAVDTGLGISSTGVGNAAGESGVTGQMQVYHAGSASEYTRFAASGGYDNTIGNGCVFTSSGRRTTAQDTTAVRFFYSSGNIASGTIRMYGVT
jgi:hypothetical protein